MIEEVLEEQALVAEGQTGTAFEKVLVDVAKLGAKTVRGRNVPAYGIKPSSLKKDKKYKNKTLVDLSIKALEQMGHTNVDLPVDEEAEKMSTKGTGISGDPKTDVFIKDSKGEKWNISLKLPGDIQLGGPGPTTAKELLQLVFKDFKEKETEAMAAVMPVVEVKKKELEQEAEKSFGEMLQEQLNDLSAQLDAVSGRYYVHDNYVETLVQKLIKKDNPPTEEEARTFAENKLKQFKEQDLKDWDNWLSSERETTKEKFKDFIETDPKFTAYVIDEYLTGRRLFASNPEAIANALLSPAMFVKLKSFDQVADFIKADDGAFLNALNIDMRGRGRPFLGKEVSVKIDFKDKIYNKLLQAAILKSQCNAATNDNEEQLQEMVNKCQTVQTVAQEIAKEAVSVEILESDQVEET